MRSGPPQLDSENRADSPLRVVFMGTPALAAEILERLTEAPPAILRVVGVVTRPDAERGRGLSLSPSEVARVAGRLGLPVLKPEKLRSQEFLAALTQTCPDVIVVAAYGRILPAAVLGASRLAPINVHASLLPRHRGAAPIEGAILAGDPVSGVTIMRITGRVDAGPILLKRELPLAADETQGTLKQKLALLGAEALIEALALLERGELVETPQDESLATYTKPVQKGDAIIDWNAPAVTIERMTRAYNPWPVARTTIAGSELLIWHAGVADEDSHEAPPGTVVRLSPQVTVQCGRGLLTLIEVQAPGRRRISAADFARGKRLTEGARLAT